MENNQSTQQSSELGDSKLVRSSRRNAPSDNLNSLLMLFKRWNWLTWVGVWVLLLALTAISILSLIHPISSEQQEPEPKTVAAEKLTETSSQTGSLPLWVIGAAVTFAAGSLLIFKRLSSSSHSDIRRRSSGRALTRRQQRKLLLQGHSSSPPQPELLSPTAPMPVEIEPVVMLPQEESLVDSGEESLAQMLGDRPSLSASDLTAGKCLNAESEPVVTVLPPESSHLVDSEEESLAEMMDIRRHRSLASILQNFKI